MVLLNWHFLLVSYLQEQERSHQYQKQLEDIKSQINKSGNKSAVCVDLSCQIRADLSCPMYMYIYIIHICTCTNPRPVSLLYLSNHFKNSQKCHHDHGQRWHSITMPQLTSATTKAKGFCGVVTKPNEFNLRVRIIFACLLPYLFTFLISS